MDPMQALRSAETALRLAITRVLGDSWALVPGAPEVKSFEKKRDEEKARRDGAVASQDLLDYTETYQLTQLIQKSWEAFKPVFHDSKRTFVYCGILLDVRNTVAHSRDLLKFETDLLAGVSGKIRNQVALFRSGHDESTRYHPLFERIVDSFGTAGENTLSAPPRNRIDIGTELHFSGSAFGANGTPSSGIYRRPNVASMSAKNPHGLEPATGSNTRMLFQRKMSARTCSSEYCFQTNLRTTGTARATTMSASSSTK